MPQRTLIRKEEKQPSGCEAGRDRLTLLFCANAVGFMVRTALIYKAAKPRALKGKDKHQLLVFWLYNKKAWTTRTLFLHWFHWCFAPEVRKYFVSKGLPFEVLLVLDNTPGHPEPHAFNPVDTELIYLAPITMSLILLLDEGLITYRNIFREIKKWKNPDRNYDAFQ